MDYSLFYRRSIPIPRASQELGRFDIFISAYNSAQRVGEVFALVNAKRKFWLIHPEYEFSADELPAGELVVPDKNDEISQVAALLQSLGDINKDTKVCIDITGFMRHVLVFLTAKLQSLGLESFTSVYSEPLAYSKQENTAFSTRTSGVVRPIFGLSGSYISGAPDNVLVGVGYDHGLVGEVINNKDGAAFYPIFAFPSLSADMYQQSAVRAARSGDKALEGDWITKRHFAPANDPFCTASVVSRIVSEIESASGNSNFYLSPLATKAQALGFALFWCLEGRHKPSVTVLMPEPLSYSRETSVGMVRLWSYEIEFW